MLHIFKCEDKHNFLNSLLQNKDRNNLYKRTIRRFILAMAIIAKNTPETIIDVPDDYK